MMVAQCLSSPVPEFVFDVFSHFFGVKISLRSINLVVILKNIISGLI